MPVAGALAQSVPSLSFGVLNQQSPVATAERWNPILAYAGLKAGVQLELRMGATVQRTNAMMGRGEFDFVYTNHNFQTEFERIGYSVIARWAGDPIRGLVVVRASSKRRTLADLHGLPVAFPSADAFVAYAVPIMALQQAGATVREVFAGNQEGALAQLAADRVEAAAVNSRFLAEYRRRRPLEARVMYESEPYPELAVIVHPRVPAAIATRVRDALVGMTDDPAAAPTLARAIDRFRVRNRRGIRQSAAGLQGDRTIKTRWQP